MLFREPSGLGGVDQSVYGAWILDADKSAVPELPESALDGMFGDTELFDQLRGPELARVGFEAVDICEEVFLSVVDQPVVRAADPPGHPLELFVLGVPGYFTHWASLSRKISYCGPTELTI